MLRQQRRKKPQLGHRLPVGQLATWMDAMLHPRGGCDTRSLHFIYKHRKFILLSSMTVHQKQVKPHQHFYESFGQHEEFSERNKPDSSQSIFPGAA